MPAYPGNFRNTVADFTKIHEANPTDTVGGIFPTELGNFADTVCKIHNRDGLSGYSADTVCKIHNSRSGTTGIGPILSVELMALASLEIRQTVLVESVASETINAFRES